MEREEAEAARRIEQLPDHNTIREIEEGVVRGGRDRGFSSMVTHSHLQAGRSTELGSVKTTEPPRYELESPGSRPSALETTAPRPHEQETTVPKRCELPK